MGKRGIGKTVYERMSAEDTRTKESAFVRMGGFRIKCLSFRKGLLNGQIQHDCNQRITGTMWCASRSHSTLQIPRLDGDFSLNPNSTATQCIYTLWHFRGKSEQIWVCPEWTLSVPNNNLTILLSEMMTATRTAWVSWQGPLHRAASECRSDCHIRWLGLWQFSRYLKEF